MLREGWIEEGVRRIGAEQEMFLVGEDWRPASLATRVLDRLGGPPFTTELALFNLEANLDPLHLSGRCFSDLHAALDGAIAEVSDAADREGARVLLAGHLPTLVKSDLTLDQITPVQRYYTLNEALTRMRGGEYSLRMEGVDELMLEHDSVMLEACNASFQVHLQVGVEEFPRLYNTAQLMVAPVLAAGVNSPSSSAGASGPRPGSPSSSSRSTPAPERRTSVRSARGSASGTAGSRSRSPSSSRRISRSSRS